MPKFKITATMTTTRVLTKLVDSKTLEEATAKVLLESEPGDWKATKTLKTTSK